MSHLTKKQRSKFLNSFSGFTFRSFEEVQVTYPEKKQVETIKTYHPQHVRKIKGFCQLDKKITLTELVNHLLTYNGMLGESKMYSFRGRVQHTVEYLENEGFLMFLPDTNGELTFCNYKYFKQLNNE